MDVGRRLGALLGTALAVLLVAACGASVTSTAAHNIIETTTSSLPAPPTPTTTEQPARPCVTAHPSLLQGMGNGAAGTGYTSDFLANTGTGPCSLEGWPGVAVLDAGGNVVRQPATRTQGPDFNYGTVTVVTLLPGQSARFLVTNVDVFPTQDCPTELAGTTLQVYPPGQTFPLRQPYTGNTSDVCGLKVGPVQPVPRCHTSDLTASVGPTGAAAGHAGTTLDLTDNGASCYLYGHVGLQLLGADQRPLPTDVVRGSSMLHADPGPTYVLLPNGTVAPVGIGFIDQPGDPADECPRSSYLAITPPDETSQLVVPADLHPVAEA